MTKDTFEQLARGVLKKAKETLLNCGSLPPIVIILQGDGIPLLLPLDLTNEDTKYASLQVAKHIVNDTNALGYIIVAEAWEAFIKLPENATPEDIKAAHESAEAPSLNPDRREVILVTAVQPSKAFGCRALFTRERGKIIFGEETWQPMEGNFASFFGPLQ